MKIEPIHISTIRVLLDLIRNGLRTFYLDLPINDEQPKTVRGLVGACHGFRDSDERQAVRALLVTPSVNVRARSVQWLGMQCRVCGYREAPDVLTDSIDLVLLEHPCKPSGLMQPFASELLDSTASGRVIVAWHDEELHSDYSAPPAVLERFEVVMSAASDKCDAFVVAMRSDKLEEFRTEAMISRVMASDHVGEA